MIFPLEVRSKNLDTEGIVESKSRCIPVCQARYLLNRNS